MPLRQASLADPRMDAWCSFCCRPKQEVGQLVAGPAGAFICGSCVLLATELLGEDEADDGADS
jgi:ATP-dependent protease Clp ATPase subunit